MSDPEIIRKKFKDLYNEKPMLFRSPGRVNLIGEHTDYNEGFVLPAAIDKDIPFIKRPEFYAIISLVVLIVLNIIFW